MKQIVIVLLAGLLMLSCEQPKEKTETKKKAEFAIVIHGGAGYMRRAGMSKEREIEYRKKLAEVLKVGYKILEDGGSSLDAVEKVINTMEDSPMFNSGKGAVFTGEGKNELDASIMNGENLEAGAVAGVTIVKNPVSLARLVMEKSPHVLLARDGAEKFAEMQNVELVEPEYFYTEDAWNALQRAKESELKKTDEDQSALHDFYDSKFGTVGCVALDKNGNLAAGTSTGGMTNKKWGRIGDSPIIGAGTYANNKTCGVSSTGHGEFFIRYAAAYDISALMEYKNMTVSEAADFVVNVKLKNAGGNGGVIAMDKYGNVAMPFNTTGMFRGYVKNGEEPVVKVFADE
ncbi:MAG: isoaspartyl peptidase/L-asparaginase [Melioribacteraceae bacterium]|nr:isoaspartyl peptidase/L-asparaginase [Melioribacteraceae bacterium]MCF8356859.1 isoaspartyl peptidase/L-asparaginase [Melioribacteraceae bacterium]MCF8396238.1 isoaspartyl peptidase/L-asparaginase [Melioribacteraceae bacterium]MCF8421156.1 isoaspartyl peptidase/L-asparaginase [Melioribacteraceae bacterium]